MKLRFMVAKGLRALEGIARNSEDIARGRASQIVDFALKYLRDHSPVGGADDPHPGLYRDSHTLFVNGHSAQDLSGWSIGQEIEISNPVPYARKIEIGAMHVNVPTPVYDLAAQAVSAQFRGEFDVKFEYMPITFDTQAMLRPFARKIGSGTGRRGLRRASRWMHKQPALIITPI